MSSTPRFQPSKKVCLLHLVTLVPQMYTDIRQLLYNKIVNQPTAICRQKVQKRSDFSDRAYLTKIGVGLARVCLTFFSCNGIPLQALRATYRSGTTC